MNLRIKTVNTQISNLAARTLLAKLCENRMLINHVRDIQEHFADERCGWSLSYHAYMNMMKISELEFYALLEALDMKLCIGRKSGVLSFKPRKKASK